MSYWKNRNIISTTIRFYDYLVNDINCNYVWRCNKTNIFELYKSNLKSNHLEIGPGSGYFLYPQNHCKNIKKLKLMDINKSILNSSQENLTKYYNNIKIYHHNIFEQKINLPNVESVGINYVLHCVPGKLEDKFDRLLNNLPSDINIFGSTVVNDKDKQTLISKTELLFLNKYGIFNNKLDYSNNLINFLKYNNLDHQTKIVGNVLLFEITKS